MRQGRAVSDGRPANGWILPKGLLQPQTCMLQLDHQGSRESIKVYLLCNWFRDHFQLPFFLAGL